MHLWKECTIFEKSWVVFFTASYLLLFGLGSINLLTLATAFMGSVCMFLGAKAKIINFYPGAVYTLLYAYQCYLFGYQTVLYLHIFFHFPLQFVGAYMWHQNRIGHPVMHEDIMFKQLFPKGWIAVLLGLILATFFFALMVYSLGDGPPNLDILAFVFSIVANILMIGRFVEHWVAWLCLNVFSISLWTYTALTTAPTYSIAFMWLIFFGNCSYGCYRWNKMSKLQMEMFAGPYCSLEMAKPLKKMKANKTTILNFK